MTTFIFLFAAACFLAYTNGANDNFKGVATLFGAGAANYRKALAWASITTFLGSLSAIFLAEKLIKNFSGKGLVPDVLIQDPNFAISIALGAGITVLIATRIGMPISTTHSLVGALFGSGVVAVGLLGFNFHKLVKVFLFPLIASPLMAATISLLAYLLFRHLRKLLGIQHVKQDGAVQNHHIIYSGRILGLTAQPSINVMHYLSAGVVSFARGLNDTPKIAGLLLVINSLDIQWGMLALAVAIVLGGLINAKKVAHTMSKDITAMNHGQGFTANLVTGLLVTTASIHGMPVSTTHVSVGSIFGIGAASRKADLTTVKKILLSWVLTLPVGALCAAIVFYLLRLI